MSSSKENQHSHGNNTNGDTVRDYTHVDDDDRHHGYDSRCIGNAYVPTGKVVAIKALGRSDLKKVASEEIRGTNRQNLQTNHNQR